jgi:hypothetical protein
VAVRVVEVALPNKAVALVRATDLDTNGEFADRAGDQVAERAGWQDGFDFEGVSSTLEGIAQAVRTGLEKIAPTKTTVELGIELAVKNGRLTGLIVEGGVSASLRVTLEWGGGPAAADTPPSAISE